MFDFDCLIGLDKNKAIEILSQNGYNNVEVVINSKENSFCDSLLVCAALQKNDKVVLTMGEFYLNLKG